MELPIPSIPFLLGVSVPWWWQTFGSWIGRGAASVLANAGQEARTKFLELAQAHPFDRQESLAGRGPVAGHLAQAGVAEDEVRRDPPLLGHGAAESPEDIKQVVVARRAADLRR